MKRKIARREFFKEGTLAAAVVGGAAMTSKASARVSPNDQIVAGFIGVGRMGMSNIRDFAKQKEVRLAAVCDVYEPNLKEAEKLTGAETYKDFRRILERKDIDVVVVSTPDHWHPLMAVLACQAGKDVYVEKPTSVAVEEGRKMVEAARKSNRIVQVGTQQRSGIHFQHAVELIRRGDIGKVTAVRSWNFGNSSPKGFGYLPDSDPPAGLDWDMWLGPAPLVPFNANRFGVFPDRWSSFRHFWDYAGGMMTDWGVHLLDIVQWAMNVDGPEEVSARGGKFVIEDNRDTPDTLSVTYKYPTFVATYENRDCNGRTINEHGYGIEFYGTEGTLFIDRGGFEVSPETRRQGERRIARMYWMKEENSNDQHEVHVRNFVDCVKSRQFPISDIEIGHRSTTTCLLGNIAYRTGRTIGWDAKKEAIVGDAEAAKMLRREYRAPWKLEV